MTNIRAICHASDQERWNAERRFRITASDMMVFCEAAPSWWSDTRADLIQRKLENKDRVFDVDTRAQVEHGARSEALNMELTADLMGAVVSPSGTLYVNERWPYIGATPDGVLSFAVAHDQDLRLTTDPEHHARLAARIRELDPDQKTLLLESKNARHPDPYGNKRKKGDRTAWFEEWPGYHFHQLQTLMWVLEEPRMLISGRLGGRDLMVHLVERDPDFKMVMDAANEDAALLFSAGRDVAKEGTAND